MFHVSTLLPHSKIERQQLERKRHIGNDIVTIIFQETDTPFNPECITSQFLHVYLIVTPVNDEGTLLKVSVIHRDSVPPFGPVIPQSQTFACDATFKHWLLTKLINAEIAACRSNSFQRFQVKRSVSLVLLDELLLLFAIRNARRPLYLTISIDSCMRTIVRS